MFIYFFIYIDKYSEICGEGKYVKKDEVPVEIQPFASSFEFDP